MQYYYIPLCSKDFTFENIFSSESISPASFYAQRGFGIDYFYQIPETYHKEAIVLFGQPPKYNIVAGAPDLAKFILAVSEEALDQNELFFIKEGAWGYPKTIYLSKSNFNLLFFSEREKKIVCLKAETSLPTKGLRKYEKNFKLITEDECKPYDFNGISSTVWVNQHTDIELRFDRQVNFIKGFLYGILGGIMNSPSKEEASIRAGFSSITNAFAEFKNRLENNKPDLKYAKPFSTGSPTDGYYRKLVDLIGDSEKQFIGLFPGPKLTNDELAKFLSRRLAHFFPVVEKAVDYLNMKFADDEILGTRHEAKIRAYYLKHAEVKSPVLYFDVLREEAATYRSVGSQSTQWARNNKDDANERFKDALSELEKFADAEFLRSSSNKHANLDGIEYDFASHSVKFQPGFQTLSNEAMEEFCTITNIILANPKMGKGEVSKDQLLSLVEKVGSSSLKNKKGTESLLYQYLNNEINNYDFEKIASVVTKNFVSFIFNINSLEKLSNYLTTRDVELRWISFSFWSAFHGFANMSRNFLKVIFDSPIEVMQDYADNYIRKVMARATHTDSPKQESISTAISELAASPRQDTAKRSKQCFFDEFVAGKFTISYEEFDAITKMDDKDKIVQAFKEKTNSSKKESKKILDTYKNYMDPKSLF